MPKPTSTGKFGFEIVSSKCKAIAAPDPDTPFRILVMGDFSGRGRRGPSEKSALPRRRIHPVDRDNLDELIGKLGVEVQLPLYGQDNPPVVIRFSELDDFHPDSLFERLEIFKSVSETRRQLRHPSYSAQAQQEKGEKIPGPASPENEELSIEKLLKAPLPQEAGLFEKILQQTVGERPERGSSLGPSELDRFLKRIVEPHLVRDAGERQSELPAVDEAAGALMRAILHTPDFQAMEAAWRGIDFLLSRIETGEELKLYLLDISKADLCADLLSTNNLAESTVYRLLVEQTLDTPGAEPWALLAGNYTFGCDREDIEVLGKMAQIASAAGAPFIAAAGSGMLRCASLAHTPGPGNRERDEVESLAWETLRRLPEASWVGLALPGFLLRLPYGAKTEQIEIFDFEELKAEPEHDRYLWGNPCFFCACLLAQAFSDVGWELRPGTILEISGLPLHVYKDRGEPKSKPCAEVLLTHTAAEAILGNGIMPLLAFKDQDKVRLARFQSVADPPGLLSGRWG
jgi:type VI secretion system protein ImpC